MTDRSGESEAGKFLTFVLSGQMYGVSIDSVRNICRAGDILHVPQMPHFVVGVMHLDEQVIPIVDLKMRLGLSQGVPPKKGCMIVFETASGDFGALVDSIGDIISLAPGQINTGSRLGDSSPFVIGTGSTGRHVIILLDIARCTF